MKQSLPNIIIVNKESITHSLSHLVGIVEKRNSNEEFSHVKIDPIDNKTIKITATNREISVVEIVLVESSNIEQSFTLPAMTLYEIVKKFPQKSLLRIEQAKHNTIEITSSAIFFALPFKDANTFPLIAEDEMDISLSLSPEHFKQLFTKTKFAISTEDSRYNLTGLYLHEMHGKLRAAATDGHRMALSAPDINAKKFGILISRKTVMELVRIFEINKRSSDKTSDAIQVYISSKKVKFKYDKITLISKLISADFPNYQNIIPKNYTKEAVINKVKLIESIDRVSAIYDDKSTRSINLLFSTDSLEISASTLNSSNAHENLTIKYIGDNFNIKFNYNYLLEIFAHLDEDNVKFHFNNSNSAAMIENNEIIYMVMPMSA